MLDDMNSNPEQGSQEQSTSVNEQAQDASQELALCKAERDIWKDKFLRVQADFDNFSKRNEKDRLQWRNSVQAAMLIDLLPIVDDFDRALEQNVQVSADMQTWFSGIQMIRKSLQKLLEKYEVQEIPAGLPFDPLYHEALVQVEASGKPSGDIVGILQKGYTFRGQVLRPAKVSVAK